ncbi:hypothetical protein RFI_09795, partial [Reticulomyxa filosa]
MLSSTRYNIVDHLENISNHLLSVEYLVNVVNFLYKKETKKNEKKFKMYCFPSSATHLREQTYTSFWYNFEIKTSSSPKECCPQLLPKALKQTSLSLFPSMSQPDEELQEMTEGAKPQVSAHDISKYPIHSTKTSSPLIEKLPKNPKTGSALIVPTNDPDYSPQLTYAQLQHIQSGRMDVPVHDGSKTLLLANGQPLPAFGKYAMHDLSEDDIFDWIKQTEHLHRQIYK